MLSIIQSVFPCSVCLLLSAKYSEFFLWILHGGGGGGGETGERATKRRDGGESN